MREGWREVKLGEVLEQIRRPVEVASLVEVRYAGVRWYAGGVYERNTVSVAKVKAKSLDRIYRGDIVYNRMWATKASFGIVGEEADGCLVTNDFPIFRVRESLALAEYIALLFFWPPFQAAASGAATGTTERRRLNEKVFFTLTIPLPPLDEQRRIVDIIGSLDDAIEAAEHAYTSLLVAMDAVPDAVRARGDGSNWSVQSLVEVIGEDGEIRTGPFGSQLHKSDYVEDGLVPVVMPANLKRGRVDLTGIARIGPGDAERLSRHITKVGDILWARRGDVTRFAVIDDESQGSLCGTGCFLIRLENPCDSRWLEMELSSQATADWLVDHAVGATMLNLNRSILSRIPVHVPPAEYQDSLAEGWAAIRDAHTALHTDLLQLRELRSNLLTVLLSGEHEIPADYDALLDLNETDVPNPTVEGAVP